MATEIKCYRPTEREILAIRVLKNGENCSRSVANELYRAGAVKVGDRERQCKSFDDNEVYEFSNGLVFRLFDAGLRDGSECLEFMADPDAGVRPADVFRSLPDLLGLAGIDDEWALAMFRRYVWHLYPESVVEDTYGF